MTLRSPTENENGGIFLHPKPNFQRRHTEYAEEFFKVITSGDFLRHG
jgi:hypothetical protein